MHLERNDPCYCGSGKKYKKCHMFKDSNTSQIEPKPFGKIFAKWIKNPEEIEKMRNACRFNAKLMDYVRSIIIPGMSTSHLDDIIRVYTYDHGHIPACLNYRNYKKSSCISVNEVVCHGVPKDTVILKDGDIVNVDVTTIVKGFYGDQSESFLLGNVSKEASHLVTIAANAMVEGIYVVAPNNSFGKIGEVIENYVHSFGYSVVVDYTGHGIGKAFHEDPPIYHFKNTETLPYLMAPGMTFTIEPMINQGTYKVDLDKSDSWTVRTRDRKLSAQFEHTILVTETGFEILTLTETQSKAKKISLLASVDKNNLCQN